MKAVVAQPAFGQFVQGGCWRRAAECGRRSKAYVVEQDQDYVGRALRRSWALRPVRRRFVAAPVDIPFKLGIGVRQCVRGIRGPRAKRDDSTQQPSQSFHASHFLAFQKWVSLPCWGGQSWPQAAF